VACSPNCLWTAPLFGLYNFRDESSNSNGRDLESVNKPVTSAGERFLGARLLHLRFGSFLRFVLAISSSSFSLIELAMLFDAPLKLDFARFPRFVASAAPAAFCCFLDFAFAIFTPPCRLLVLLEQ
jgi:hypothetical protein